MSPQSLRVAPTATTSSSLSLRRCTYRRVAFAEHGGNVIEIAASGRCIDRRGMIGELDRCRVGRRHLAFLVGNILCTDDVVPGKVARIGKADAQDQLVDSLLQLSRERAARRELCQSFAEIGTHVFVGATPLEVAVVTRKAGDFCAQFFQRTHGGRGTTHLGEGPRRLLWKILAVKHATAWPAYLVAAACFAIALISSIANISLLGQVKQEQRELATLSERSTALARNLVDERTALFDMLDSHARHYQIGNGEVITRAGRIYLALRALPEPPRGKVYQAWTLAKGSTKVAASPTFLPDARGVALILLSADARSTSEVSVTLEPDGGSKEPTSKPLMEVNFNSQ